MKPINYRIKKLASIASKAIPLAIFAASLFATPPVVFGQSCSFSWPANPIHVRADRSGFGIAGTITVSKPYLEGFQKFTQTSGGFNFGSQDNLAVDYPPNAWWYQNSPPLQYIFLYPGTTGISLTGIVPYAAQAGQSATVTMVVENIGGVPICSSSVTVIVDPICSGNAALIQSTFGKQGNFEVVFPNDEVSSPSQTPGAGMVHYYRDNDNGGIWHGPTTVFGAAVGTVNAVSLIESSYGNLEVVARIGNQLAHFFRDSGTGIWYGPTFFATGVSGTPSLIQSKSGNFEVVTPRATGDLAYFHRVGNNTWSFVKAFATGSNASDVSLIESTYGNLEVDARIGSQLAHFWRDSSSGTWNGPTVFANGVSGTPSLIQDPWVGITGNFEVVTPQATGDMAHYYRNNSNYSYQPWYGPTAQFGSGAINSASLIQSNYGNLEVVSRAATCSMDHYWRNSLGQWSGPTVIVP